MATHSSMHAWRIPWTKEHGRLLYLGSQRVRQDLSNLVHTHTHTYMYNKKECPIDQLDQLSFVRDTNQSLTMIF